jgi:outer membrane protein assembly factor BamE (lipoprotein component of BamABCDE complex)
MIRSDGARAAGRFTRLLACAALAACSTIDDARIARLDDAQAQSLLAPGRTTEADVRAALGEGSVVHFRSGWETWHYEYRAGLAKGWDDVPFIGLVTSRSARPTKELVLLFDAGGTLRRYALQEEPPTR